MAKEVARGAEVALKLTAQSTARDALVDPEPGDFVPGIEDKGYHVGNVRQPAEPVLTDDGAVHFESVGESASKFPSYADQVKAVDKLVQGRPSTMHVPVTATADEVAAARQAQGGGDRPKAVAPKPTGTVKALDASAAAVGASQAAEDRS